MSRRARSWVLCASMNRRRRTLAGHQTKRRRTHQASPGNGERSSLATLERVWRLRVCVQVAGNQRCQGGLTGAVRVERSTVNGIAEAQVRLDRIGVLAKVAAWFMAPPNRNTRHALDMSGHRFFVGEIVELGLQVADTVPHGLAETAKDTEAVQIRQPRRTARKEVRIADHDDAGMRKVRSEYGKQG